MLLRHHARPLTGVALGLMLVALGGCSAAVDPLAIADAQTAARVKTALVNDVDLGALAIEVRVVRGIVQLSGRVRSAADADRAIALARTVSGVQDVKADLQVGADPSVLREGQSEEGAAPALDSRELEANPSLLAVGAAMGWSTPRASALQRRIAISPLIKLGAPQGLGPAVALGWFQAELQSLAERSEILTRVYVRPIMGGLGYTLASGRVSVSMSVVGGVALNSLTVTDTGSAAGLPVEVDNSLAWRPGLSMWYDTSRRTTLNLSVGHVMTRLRVTVLEEGRLVKRDARGDTTIVHAGIAYRLF